jgi:hypothetical protein
MKLNNSVCYGDDNGKDCSNVNVEEGCLFCPTHNPWVVGGIFPSNFSATNTATWPIEMIKYNLQFEANCGFCFRRGTCGSQCQRCRKRTLPKCKEEPLPFFIDFKTNNYVDSETKKPVCINREFSLESNFPKWAPRVKEWENLVKVMTLLQSDARRKLI